METNFLVKARYIMEYQDGTMKRVTSSFIINALNFTEAEARIYKEVGLYTRGEFVVTAMAKQEIADIFKYDDAETWYKSKVDYISEDADSGKEKKITNYYLLTAHTTEQAIERVKESLNGLMISYDISKIERTKIVEVFAYEAPEQIIEEEKESPNKINVAETFEEEE